MSHKEERKKLLDLFLIFLKLGTFTFGGGFAMIPLIEKEIVHKKKWADAQEIIDVFAVAQSIPGAIAINSATFIGYKIAGRKGAVVATIGVILPSVFIITLIASVFSRFQDNEIVQAAFMGIRSCVVALILSATISMAKKVVIDKLTLILVILTIVSILALNVHPILAIIFGAMVGLIIVKFLPQRAQKILEEGVE